MSKKKTTGPYSVKPYQCGTCAHVTNHGTNHWGSIYTTHCPKCGTYPSWTCKEEMPEGYEKPEEWKTMTLADLDDPTKVDPTFAKYYKEFLQNESRKT